MSEQLVDSKLKRLIELCKETSNYRKLAYVGFILVSNKVEEIIVRLGIRFREKKQGEKVFNYMTLVNSLFLENVNVEIFPKELIQIVMQVEILLEKTENDIFQDRIKDLFDVYYELRKFEIPDLTQQIQSADVLSNKPMSMLSFFSGSQEQKKKKGVIHSMLLHKLTQEEQKLQNELKYEFKKEPFENLLHVKSIKDSLKSSKNKIKISGTLKDNINYVQENEGREIYVLYGIVFAFLLVGLVCLTQMILIGVVSTETSLTLLVCFAIIFGLFLAYKTLFKAPR